MTQDLGTLPGYPQSRAFAINKSGLVVGWSGNDYSAVYDPNPNGHAFLYGSGGMKDLNSLLPPNSNWTLVEARGVNDAGQITGWGLHNGVGRGFLMTPH